MSDIMYGPLAVTIDDTIVNWVLGTCAAALPVIGTTLVVIWKKATVFFGPKITRFFDAHSGLVEQLKTQAPLMQETLRKLGDTQDKQCATLEQHGQILEAHQERLDYIANAVKGGKDVQ